MKYKTNRQICGIDEAGRGPLAGPVCAAAVILSRDFDTSILKDSKKLSSHRREEIYAELQLSSSSIGTGWAWPEEIDLLNIHRASLLAMERAFSNLVKDSPCPVDPSLSVLVDGKFTPRIEFPAEAIVKGDAKVPAISAASIVAKVVRDRWMIRYSWIEPEWEFDRHKGYPTKRHREICRRIGLSPIHRKSFKIL